MDMEHLFKRLTRGIKFDKDRFINDALKLQMVKTQEPTLQLLTPTNPELKSSKSRKRKAKDDDEEEENDETLNPDQSKRKKKKDKKAEKRIHREHINHIRKVNRIHTYGSDVPEPIEAFTNIRGIQEFPQLLENIQNSGYVLPTPVQMQAIPIMIQGREILVSAPTGSGKTAAFLIPLIMNLAKPCKVGFRGLVLAPTWELAQQIYRECERLTEKTGLRCFLMGKKEVSQDKFAKTKKCDILITCPNRLVYLMKKDGINLTSLEYFVVDECDNMFEGGFQDQLGYIYSHTDNPKMKRYFFSATCGYEVEQFCKAHLDNHITLAIGDKNAAVDLVEQLVTFVGNESGKLIEFRDLIKKGIESPALVFVQSKERANELFSELIYEGISCEVIHSGKTLTQRNKIVESFRLAKIHLLICTTLMSRGVDFPAVKLVVNYDMPASPVQYIHSVGRTGRNGKTGKAVTLVTEDDKENLRRIAQVLKNSGFPVPPYVLQLKKVRRKELKLPKRNHVSRLSAYDKERTFKKRQMISQSKSKKKRELVQKKINSKTSKEEETS